MAIYHFSSKMISRGKGQSATASSAYRSGEKLYSEKYGETNFYPRKVKPESFILKPDNAPDWCLNREKLWNEVEKIEKYKNAQLAREINIALPKELSEIEQLSLTKDFVKENFVNEGMVADVSIHRDDKENPHFHVMLTTRPFDDKGNWGIKTKTVFVKDENGNQVFTKNGSRKNRKTNINDWDSKEKLTIWRKSWADKTNKYLEKNGYSETISEKSYAELGVEKKPTIHEGYEAREIDKRGGVSERIEKNREVTKENYKVEVDRKDKVSNQTVKEIVQPLSPKEKSELRKVAKNLKVFVNYDNLIDKERMVNNWEKSVKLNEIIKPDSTDNNLNEKIESTKNDIETGKEILEKQYIRLFEKYYPELNKKPLSNYYKFSISQETLKQDKVLNADELVIVLDKARTKELESMLKTITKNPYIQPIKNYQRQLFTAKKEVDNFYEDNKITKEEIYKLPDNKKDEIKKLISYQDLQLNTIQVMNKYYEQNILTNYPTLELKDITLGEKEELSKAIDYYGNTLSITKLMEKTRENVISKYSYNEQKIGMEFINKLDNNTFTKEDLKAIENDYRKKEIYETISDPAMRKLFMQEVETNGFTEQFSEQSEKQTQPLLSFLAKRINIYDNLLKATEDNKKRELNQNKKTDKSTNKKGQKQKQNSTRGI